MPSRLSFEESCQALQNRQLLDAGEVPPHVRFFKVTLANAKLERLTLPRTFFGRCEIRKISFKDSDLAEATAHWNDFIDVDFRGVDLSRSDLRACVFERVRFAGAMLAGVDFRYCGFKRCDFTGADLSDAKLTHKAGAALKLSAEQQSVIDWQAEDGEEPEG